MLEKTIQYIDDHFDQYINTLKQLVRIPSVSAPGFPVGILQESAEAVRKAMAEYGLEHCCTLELPGAHPYVYGDWLHAPGKPTVLLYAHHDVQPPGRSEHWQTPPFEPTLRADGRLYGRGVVDDKAGILVHLASIQAWLKTQGQLPLNVKVIIEGEEEIGSDHLLPFLKKYQEQLRADVMVLTDAANLELGLPSLTYRLRGIATVALEVTALEHPLHSGMWGGPIPDPVQAMAKILATLSNENGVPVIPGLYDEVVPPSPYEREALAKLPWDVTQFRHDGGVLSGVHLIGEPEYSVYEQLWLRPSIAVIALEASPLKGSSNQIIPSARARISVRLVPNMTPARTAQLVMEHVKRVAPWGVSVRMTAEPGAPAWECNPTGPVFEATKRALARGFGRNVALIGAGGTVPFVGPFAEAFGGIPALLTGIEDPICNAHAENESLHLDDFRKAIKGGAFLYAELAGISS